MSEILCPCGSGQDYPACCQPYHKGENAQNAETLVRARFSAFALHEYDFIIETTHPIYRDEVAESNIADNLEKIIWHQLHITHCGQEDGTDGKGPFDTVTFSAMYEINGNMYSLSEKSYFQEHEGKLYYLEGISHKPDGFKRANPKVGRNDPCPCGSGKKHKKCCG